MREVGHSGTVFLLFFGFVVVEMLEFSTRRSIGNEKVGSSGGWDPLVIICSLTAYQVIGGCNWSSVQTAKQMSEDLF
jgi:hypothetical protein